MTTHADHEDVHTHGLAGECPRCQELALEPRQLDQRMIARLLEGTIYTALDREAARRLGPSA